MRLTPTSLRHAFVVMTITFGTFGCITSTPALAEEVYMIRGFMNVFSKGMDQMTRRLRSRGVRAISMSNGDWNSKATSIIRRAKQGRVSYPIVIVGHSLGGVEVPNFANALVKGGVKVSLAIGLDPGFANPNPFGRGVRSVINYKIPGGNNYRAGRGFNGRIQNIVITGVDHVGIDKNSRVQSRVIRKIMSRIGK